jgi:hypothetical protein
MTPDYGEPWKEKAYNYTVGDTGDVDGVIEIRTREELKVADTWNPSDENEALFSRAITCVNACAGMADPAAEIESMREAIREAASHLSGFLGFHSDDLSLDQVKALSATLAKLKLFIPDASPPKP